MQRNKGRSLANLFPAACEFFELQKVGFVCLPQQHERLLFFGIEACVSSHSKYRQTSPTQRSVSVITVD